MTVSTSSLISRKLSHQSSQDERFRALDRNLARKYVMLLLRQARMAEAKRLREGDMLYRPRFVQYSILLHVRLNFAPGRRFVMTRPPLA